MLESNCFPTIKTLAPHEQREILADMLGVGMMHESPFQKHNPFTMLGAQHQRRYQELFVRMVDGEWGRP